MPRASEVLNGDTEPLSECCELLLFALNDFEARALANLKEKESITNFASGADHDFVWSVKRMDHEGMSSPRLPVLFTLRTTGVESVIAIAETEHVEITVR
jgi:hypothetical protein